MHANSTSKAFFLTSTSIKIANFYQTALFIPKNPTRTRSAWIGKQSHDNSVSKMHHTILDRELSVKLFLLRFRQFAANILYRIKAKLTFDKECCSLQPLRSPTVQYNSLYTIIRYTHLHMHTSGLSTSLNTQFICMKLRRVNFSLGSFIISTNNAYKKRSFKCIIYLREYVFV